MATKTTKQTRKPRQSTVPADETKAQKFVRLAEMRVKKAIVMMRNIAKLGGANYERTEEQAKTIADTLRKEVDAIAVALKPGATKAKQEVAFKL